MPCSTALSTCYARILHKRGRKQDSFLKSFRGRGFPPGMRMAPGRTLPPRPPLRGAPTNPSRMPLQELRHVALPPPSEVLGAMSSLGQTAFQANMPFSWTLLLARIWLPRARSEGRSRGRTRGRTRAATREVRWRTAAPSCPPDSAFSLSAFQLLASCQSSNVRWVCR